MGATEREAKATAAAEGQWEKGNKRQEEQMTRDNFPFSIEAAFYQHRRVPTDGRVADEERSQKKTGHERTAAGVKTDRQTAAAVSQLFVAPSSTIFPSLRT